MDPFDAYLDACLAGTFENPRAFFAQHPGLDGETRTRIEEMHRRASGRAASRALPFERLGDFRLIRRLGVGGMGTVYLARQESLDREVALKVIRPELRDSPEAAERFRREAVAVARLKHGNIVGIHAIGEAQGVRFIALDLVDGRNLDEVLAEAAARGETLPWMDAARWGAGIARALEHAHARGVIHRDVKPSNIRLSPDGRPLLLDFGIARDMSAGGATLTATFAGSPLYAAPEQLAGAALDARADVYGLGATLYQCLTGRPPFPGRTIEQILGRALTEEPVPPRRLEPSLPRDLETVVLHALARDPDARCPTAEHLALDLEALLDGRPVRARPPTLPARLRSWVRRHRRATLGIASALLAVLGASAAFAWNDLEEARLRRREATALVGRARESLERFRERRLDTLALEKRVATLRRETSARYFTLEEDRAFQQEEESLIDVKREREGLFYEVLDLLRAAERSDPEVAGTDAVRLDLYGERWQEAGAAHDGAAAAAYRDKVLALDPSGATARRLEGTAGIAITCPDPEVVIHLFRAREHADVVPAGERRVVHVPWRLSVPAHDPGEWALRIVRPSGPIDDCDLILRVAGQPVRGTVLVSEGTAPVQPLDRLVSIAGAAILDLYGAETEGASGDAREFVFERAGERFAVRGTGLEALGIVVLDALGMAERGGVAATVHQGGVIRDLVLPEGLSVRTTAAPLFFGPDSIAGTPSCSLTDLTAGDYLIVALRRGRPPLRVPFGLTPGPTSVVFDPLFPPRGAAPPDFAHVPDLSGQGRAFWILDREVTCAEYLEFLNDAEILRALDAGELKGLVPRRFDGTVRLRRGSDGHFALAPGWRIDWPVLGISWHDATAYAAWRTARARRDGRKETYALPSFAQWQGAGTVPGREYPFGNQFRPRWVKSCYARPKAHPEPGRRFPVDESPHGVYDMSGSLLEWLDDWYDKEKSLRRAAGGSWAQAGPPELFRVSGGYGLEPHQASEEFGFRLVLTMEPGQ